MPKEITFYFAVGWPDLDFRFECAAVVSV